MALTKVSRGLLSTGIVDNSTTTAITIDSSENVGIGASPLTLSGNAAPGLTVSSNGPFILLQDANNADKVRYISNNTGELQFGIVGDDGATGKTEHMRIDASGNITQTGANSADFLIKAPTDNASLTLQAGASDSGAEAAIINFLQNTTYKWQMGMDTDNGFRWYNYAASSEAMRIDTAGNLLLGTTAAILLGKTSVLFDGTNQNGHVLKTTRSATGIQFLAFLNSSNQIAGTILHNGSTTVNYGSGSDQRLKQNILDSDDSGSTIDAIKIRKFDWIDGGAHEKYGFIAQELKTVVLILFALWGCLMKKIQCFALTQVS